MDGSRRLRSSAQTDVALSRIFEANTDVSPEIRTLMNLVGASSNANIKLATAAAANFALLQRDEVINYLGLDADEARRARTTPFSGPFWWVPTRIPLLRPSRISGKRS